MIFLLPWIFFPPPTTLTPLLILLICFYIHSFILVLVIFFHCFRLLVFHSIFLFLYFLLSYLFRWQGLEYTNCFLQRGKTTPLIFVLGRTLNCIWWWGSNSGNLESMEYFVGNPWGIEAKVPNCNIKVSEFKLQSCC